MIAKPFLTPFTVPLLTVATEVSELFHDTPEVLLVSLRGLLQVTEVFFFEILTAVPVLTVSLQVALLLLVFAVMVAVPSALATTIPLAETGATEESELENLTVSLEVAFT